MASPNPLPALQALKASKAGFNLRVGNRVENWFDFINGKAHVLSVLDGSGVFSRPSGSLLDVGCGHGFLDAFVMGRYGIKGTAYARRDPPPSYPTDPLYL